MKTLLLLLAVAAAGCKKVQADAQKAREGDTAATRHVQGLQQDMKKAEAAAAAANASLQQTSRSVDDALQE